MSTYPTCSVVAPGGDPDDPMRCTEGSGHYSDPVDASWHGCPGPDGSWFMWGDNDDLPTMIVPPDTYERRMPGRWAVRSTPDTVEGIDAEFWAKVIDFDVRPADGARGRRGWWVVWARDDIQDARQGWLAALCPSQKIAEHAAEAFAVQVVRHSHLYTGHKAVDAVPPDNATGQTADTPVDKRSTPQDGDAA